MEALKRRLLPIAHHLDGLLVPIEIRPHVGTALAAHRADETMFYVGQPKIIRPVAAADRDRVAAAIVGAVDQNAANAHIAHFGKGDFLGAFGTDRGEGEAARDCSY